MEKIKNKKQEVEAEDNYQNYKEDKYLEKLRSEKKKILLTLNTGHTYTGFIVGLSPNSFLFVDKYDQEMMFWIKDIRRILVINSEVKK